MLAFNACNGFKQDFQVYAGEHNEIEKLLSDAGGAAFQSDIVNATGFSKSVISIVLSRMREEGKIVKIRRGRENLIRLNGSP